MHFALDGIGRAGLKQIVSRVLILFGFTVRTRRRFCSLAQFACASESRAPTKDKYVFGNVLFAAAIFHSSKSFELVAAVFSLSLLRANMLFSCSVPSSSPRRGECIRRLRFRFHQPRQRVGEERHRLWLRHRPPSSHEHTQCSPFAAPEMLCFRCARVSPDKSITFAADIGRRCSMLRIHGPISVASAPAQMDRCGVCSALVCRHKRAKAITR